jgi:cyclopropane fatty-acyl-phospholipid synthase-like methyltransferase
LDEHIIPLVEGLHERLERGINVIDVGCGRGRAILHLAQRYPKSRFCGIDYLSETVAWATGEAARRGLRNARFEQADAAKWSAPNSFDLVTTFDAVHDQARPDLVLKNIAEALRPNGVYLMQDIAASSNVHENIGHVMGPWLYTISTMHCMSVSLAAGGMGLGTAWGRQLATKMLNEAGFNDVQLRNLPHDIINDYYVCWKR